MYLSAGVYDYNIIVHTAYTVLNTTLPYTGIKSWEMVKKTWLLKQNQIHSL